MYSVLLWNKMRYSDFRGKNNRDLNSPHKNIIICKFGSAYISRCL